MQDKKFDGIKKYLIENQYIINRGGVVLLMVLI